MTSTPAQPPAPEPPQYPPGAQTRSDAAYVFMNDSNERMSNLTSGGKGRRGRRGKKGIYTHTHTQKKKNRCRRGGDAGYGGVVVEEMRPLKKPNLPLQPIHQPMKLMDEVMLTGGSSSSRHSRKKRGQGQGQGQGRNKIRGGYYTPYVPVTHSQNAEDVNSANTTNAAQSNEYSKYDHCASEESCPDVHVNATTGGSSSGRRGRKRTQKKKKHCKRNYTPFSKIRSWKRKP